MLRYMVWKLLQGVSEFGMLFGCLTLTTGFK